VLNAIAVDKVIADWGKIGVITPTTMPGDATSNLWFMSTPAPPTLMAIPLLLQDQGKTAETLLLKQALTKNKNRYLFQADLADAW